MIRTGITKTINASFDTRESGTFGRKFENYGAYLTGNINNNDELRTTVKLCIDRLHRIGMTNVVSYKKTNSLSKDEFVYKVVDMFQNCGMEPLAEQVVDYVGNSSPFTFELVYYDNYYSVSNTRDDIWIKLRTYYWIQTSNICINQIDDTNDRINYNAVTLGEKFLEQLNEGIPKTRKGRTIHNYLDENVLIPSCRLTRMNAYMGPPDAGIPVGLDGEDLDIFSIECMHRYYDICDKIVNDANNPIIKRIKDEQRRVYDEMIEDYWKGENSRRELARP